MMLSFVLVLLGVLFLAVCTFFLSAGTDAGNKHCELQHTNIANLAHDLKGPLAAIQGYVETLIEKDGTLSRSERSEFLSTILRNVHMLTRFSQNALVLEKLDQKLATPTFAPISINELGNRIRNNFVPKAQAKNVSFSATLPGHELYVYADSAMLERVLTNIIENAMHYTPTGGAVHFLVEQRSSTALVSIRDTGIGIPAEDLPNIGERFYRVNKDRSKKTGGTGLGLAISKALLKAHHSSLEIESELGRGTNVSFELQVFSGC